MRALIAWLLGLLALSGCASAPAPLPVEVRVPVPVYCEPQEVARPAMPTEGLAGGEDEFEVARALWAELEIRDGYEERLRTAVDACRAPKPAEGKAGGSGLRF